MQIRNKPDGILRNFEYRSPRLHTRFAFWLQVEGERNYLLPAVCTDISDKGMGAELEESLQVDACVTLVLPSASRPDPYIIRARVASQQGQRHGFAFLAAQPEDVHEIAGAIRALSGGKKQVSNVARLLGGPERKAV